MTWTDRAKDYAKDALDVDDADAANLHVMFDDWICLRVEICVAAATESHLIVGNEAMPAFDEFQGGFAFSHARGSDKNASDAVAVERGSVELRLRGEFVREEKDDPGDDLIGRFA